MSLINLNQVKEKEILTGLSVKFVHSENWHISLRFDPEVLQNGMDPISFIRYLKKIGEDVVISRTNSINSKSR